MSNDAINLNCPICENQFDIDATDGGHGICTFFGAPRYCTEVCEGWKPVTGQAPDIAESDND